jgi:hypothetical protein
MTKYMTVALLVTLMLAYGAMAAIKTCSDTECKTCTTADYPADKCQTTTSSSTKYVCTADTTNILAWSNTDCSGAPSSNMTLGKPGVCQSYGGTYFLVTCGASWQAVVAAVAMLLAFLF